MTVIHAAIVLHFLATLQAIIESSEAGRAHSKFNFSGHPAATAPDKNVIETDEKLSGCHGGNRCTITINLLLKVSAGINFESFLPERANSCLCSAMIFVSM